MFLKQFFNRTYLGLITDDRTRRMRTDYIDVIRLDSLHVARHVSWRGMLLATI